MRYKKDEIMEELYCDNDGNYILSHTPIAEVEECYNKEDRNKVMVKYMIETPIDDSVFLFSATVQDVFDMIVKNGNYKVDYQINNDEFMTEKENKKFMKHLNKLSKISRSAFVKKAEGLIEQKERNEKEELNK